MVHKLKKPNSGGFTIIEVMIVLAVAALILLIVLLAVPALQRNSRNTAIKNDASSVAGGINTYESDNNGTPPTNVSGTGTVTFVSGGTAGGCNSGGSAPSETIRVQGSTQVSCLAKTASAPASVTPGTIDVWLSHSCPTSLGGSGASSTRSFSIFYSTETSGSSTGVLQCLDS